MTNPCARGHRFKQSRCVCSRFPKLDVRNRETNRGDAERVIYVCWLHFDGLSAHPELPPELVCHTLLEVEETSELGQLRDKLLLRPAAALEDDAVVHRPPPGGSALITRNGVKLAAYPQGIQRSNGRYTT